MPQPQSQGLPMEMFHCNPQTDDQDLTQDSRERLQQPFWFPMTLLGGRNVETWRVRRDLAGKVLGSSIRRN